MITEVEGILVGHAEDREAQTGCTVILCPPGTVGGCEVRGGSPGTRETALLGSEKTVGEVHAILLTGGSAFGLAAADGVVKFLEEKGVGVETPFARVPIVPAAVVYDLYSGRADIRPDAKMGYKAAQNAKKDFKSGAVGAGTGVTVGKYLGFDKMMKSGLGSASEKIGSLVVGALAVVNAVGDIIDEAGKVIAGAKLPNGKFARDEGIVPFFSPLGRSSGTNTTLIAVATNARLSKVEANRLAEVSQNGIARTIDPAHTSFDGDTVFTLATGKVESNFDLVSVLAVKAVAKAIRIAASTNA